MNAVSLLTGSRDPGRHLARYQASSILLTAIWGASGTQRQPGLGGSLLIGRSCPLLDVRKPAPTVAGDRLAIPVPSGVLSGGDEGANWKIAVYRSRSISHFASITASQKEATASHATAPLCTMVWTRAGRETSPLPIGVNTWHIDLPFSFLISVRLYPHVLHLPALSIFRGMRNRV